MFAFELPLAVLLERLEPPFGSYRLVALAGDASTRRYFRLYSEGQPERTAILMVFDPARARISEEGPGGGRVPLEVPFINLQRHFSRLGLPVPALLGYQEDAGLMLLSDFGDLTLEQWQQGRPLEDVERKYEEAIRHLIPLQVKGTLTLPPDCQAFNEAFDVRLLRWELDHYYEYGVVAPFGAVSSAEYRVIDDTYQALAERLASLPAVIVHRDYHSRNLMVTSHGVGILDFQDALLGPYPYDLASLLRDSYVTLPEAAVSRLLETYHSAYVAAGGKGGQTLEEFREDFDLTALHRNLKAAGRFEYIHRVKGNAKFLDSIPRTLEYVRQTLSRYSWLEPLRQVLARRVNALKQEGDR